MKTGYIFKLSAILAICPRTISAKILQKIAPRSYAPGVNKQTMIDTIEDILLSRS